MVSQLPDNSPLDPEDAKRALAQIDDRDRVVTLLLRAVRARARFVCFLAVRNDFAVGRVALSDRWDREAIAKVRVPLTSPLFQRVIGSGQPYAGPLTAGEWGVEMRRYIGGEAPKAALLLPVLVGGRMAGIAVGHFGDAVPRVDELRALFGVADAAG